MPTSATLWPSPGPHLGDRGPGPPSRRCSGSGTFPPPDSPSAPVNVTVRHLKANSAVVSWDVLEDEVVIGFAISQQVTLEGLGGKDTSRQ